MNLYAGHYRKNTNFTRNDCIYFLNYSPVIRGDATVHVPGHGLQYKSTLVKLLNEDPNLSKDR